MLVKKKICARKGCNKVFEPKTKKHAYCCRTCFMTQYRSKEEDNGLPMFKCPGCKKLIKLTFNPKKDPKKWAEYRCYSCGFRNKENDYEEIQKIKSRWKQGG